MIKVKITLAENECEITQKLQNNKTELEQLIEAFELALKGCGFDLGNKQLEFKNDTEES